MNYVGRVPTPSGMVLVGDTNPIGQVSWHHAPPDGSYLRLNGQVVAKATYPDLWAWAQGFLTADQVTNPGLYRNVDANTFALPILDGLFIRGTGGAAAALGVKQASDNLQHAHVVTDPTHVHAGGYKHGGGEVGPNVQAGANSIGAASVAASRDSMPSATGITLQNSGGAEARPNNVALVPCVKALRAIFAPALAMPVIPPSDMPLLAEKVAANSPVLDFTNLVGYGSYRFTLENIIPATNAQSLWLRMSFDNGVSFDATTAYLQAASGVDSLGAAILANGFGATQGLLATLVSNLAGYGVTGEINTNGLQGVVGRLAACVFNTSFLMDATNRQGHINGGILNNNSTQNANAIRFLFQAGNIATGVIRCYGMRKL